MSTDKIGFISKDDVFFVHKNWGGEHWIANSEKYCGKVLFLQKGKRLSWHRHTLKDECFTLFIGRVLIKYSFDDNIDIAQQVELNFLDSFHVPTSMNHQIIALEDSYLAEFSTEHFDSDSLRIIKGD